MRVPSCFRSVPGILIATVLMASTARASDGTFDLRWGSCDGPIEHCPSVAGPNALYASVIGIDQPHTSYHLQVLYGEAATNTVPDAWRFDVPGCQLGAIRFDHLAPAEVAARCPSFQGVGPSLQLKGVNFVSASFDPAVPQTLLLLELGNTYYGDRVVTPDPTKRYFLARFQFDHTLSTAGSTTPEVDCGGFEVPIRFQTYLASYSGEDGAWHSFGQSGAWTVTSHGAGTCSPVPAASSTWGAIKAQYRR